MLSNHTKRVNTDLLLLYSFIAIHTLNSKFVNDLHKSIIFDTVKDSRKFPGCIKK